MPFYLGLLVHVTDFRGRRALHSAVVPPVKLSTVGSRAFLVAAAQLWNSLPDDIVLSDLLSTFRRQLTHHPLQQSYPDVVLYLLPNCVTVTLLMVLVVAAAI